MKTFPEKVREARHELGLSQKQLGEKAGVSLRSIFSYENGQKKPYPATMLKLARALGVSVEFLTNDECDDPLEGIESDGYIQKAMEQYGYRDAMEVDKLLKESVALFAGGELSQAQKDAFFQAVMTAYVTCKEEAKKKFGRRRD